MRLKENMRVLEDLEALSRDLLSLEADTEATDLLFQVGGEAEAEVRIPGHAGIFRARCSRWAEQTIAASAQTETPGEAAVPRIVQLDRVRSEAFLSFKHFVYSGRLELDPSAGGHYSRLFGLIHLAAFFGVESLTGLGLAQVRSGLSLGSAAEMLNAAVATALEPSDLIGRDRLAEPVLTFIAENVGVLRERRLLLSLSKEALVAILQSGLLRINENEIWRFCAEWARHKAGIDDTRPLHTWTEKDRTCMRAVLTGVVQHVRLLLIDSTVFAEEVEPTGAVPIELSLERYRQAALLPDKFAVHHHQPQQQQQQQQQQQLGMVAGNNSRVENARALPAFPRGDPPPRLTRPADLSRLNPRVEADSSRPSTLHHHHQLLLQQQQQSRHAVTSGPAPSARSLFHGSGILAGLATEGGSSGSSGYYEKLLNSWAGSAVGQAWTLIFRASEHGFSAQAFHRMCDGAAPSYVLVKADTG
jgi:hypothetical protein